MLVHHKVEARGISEGSKVMTHACKEIVRSLLHILYDSVDLVPFDIRFMLRALIEGSNENWNIKD